MASLLACVVVLAALEGECARCWAAAWPILGSLPDSVTATFLFKQRQERGKVSHRNVILSVLFAYDTGQHRRQRSSHSESTSTLSRTLTGQSLVGLQRWFTHVAGQGLAEEPAGAAASSPVTAVRAMHSGAPVVLNSGHRPSLLANGEKPAEHDTWLLCNRHGYLPGVVMYTGRDHLDEDNPVFTRMLKASFQVRHALVLCD